MERGGELLFIMDFSVEVSIRADDDPFKDQNTVSWVGESACNIQSFLNVAQNSTELLFHASF